MTNLPFSLKEVLFAGQHLRLFRVGQGDHGSTSLLKTPLDEAAGEAASTRLIQEYEICKDLDVTGILQPTAKQTYQGRLAVVFEDSGGVSLSQLAAAGPVDLALFFDVAVDLTEIVGRLHRKGIVHKDIHAGNIIVCIDQQPVRVCLTGLGIAVALPGKSVEKVSPGKLEGTLAVMSPEQTGRMNRSLDYRTDYYSLGAVFYQMLTGRLPFTDDDPLALVHAHLALAPEAPSIIDSQIPTVLSDIVVKLLAKDANDRYRSAAGIAADFKRCRDEWHQSGTISLFETAQRDVPETFHLPDKLYGREEEMRILQAAFDRICGGPVELVLVTGYAGIGKTELVNQVRQSAVLKDGQFIVGKCDPLDRKIPCAPFIEAVNDAIDGLFAFPQERIDEIRDLVAVKMGSHGRVLTDLIPMLSLITDEQPPVPTLPPDQARNRFHLALQSLFNAGTVRGFPLVVLLDDLQWADSSTLKMLQTLACDSDLHNLLLIGAFRDHEVDEAHALTRTLKEIDAAGGRIQTLALGPLGAEDVSAMIADALGSTPSETADLARLCRQKTSGNPFFLKRFLHELAERKLIFFDATSNAWQWRMENIARADITDNVVELMAGTIGELDVTVQQALKSAACIGSQFDLGTLSDACELSLQSLLAPLWSAVRTGLVSMRPGPGVRFAIGPGAAAVPSVTADDTDVDRIRFSFIHDRIQEAAYGLMDDDSKMAIHLRLGRLMLEKCSPEHLDETIFNILGQLNRAVPLITQAEEIEQLAALNLQAGQRARSLAIFESAFDYFRMGIDLMAEPGWQHQYELTKELHLKGIEAAFVSGRYREMDHWFDAAVQHIHSPIEATQAYIAKIKKETTEQNHNEAIETGLAFLAGLGTHLPANPSEGQAYESLQKTGALYAASSSEEVFQLPAMTDPSHLAISNVMAAMTDPAFYDNRPLYQILACESLHMMLNHGSNKNSAFILMNYACIKLSRGELDESVAFGRISLQLLDYLKNPDYKHDIQFLFLAGILPLSGHAGETVEALLELRHSCMKNGDFIFAGSALFVAVLVRLFIGEPLGQVSRHMYQARRILKGIRNNPMLVLTDMHHQIALNIMGRSDHTKDLIGDLFDERMYLSSIEHHKNDTFVYGVHCCKLWLTYLFEAFQEAAHLADKTGHSINTPYMPWYIARCYCFCALSHLALCETDTPWKNGQALEKAAVYQQRLQSLADAAPMNHLHQLYLVKAERARVEGRFFDAQEHFDQAIALAEENGYLQDQALANELAAKFWMSRQKAPIAKLYMQQALDGYTRWGAKAKIDHLKEKHAEFFVETVSEAGAEPEGVHQRRATDLDVMSALRASRAISGEIVLERLIEKFMAVVVENAGATLGRLLLESEGGFYVAVQFSAGQSGKVFSPDAASRVEAASRLLPQQLVQYVERTQKPVVIDDATAHQRFAHDPYILENRLRSVLCSPIVYSEKVVGLIYLENRLTAGAFTAERLKMLEILSAQIAVSLENARLYEAQRQAEQELRQHHDHLEELVKRRTAQLAVAKEQAEAASRTKSAFLANMSHEIRTPMNAVVGFTDIMLKTEITERQQGYLQAVKQGGAALMRLVDDILDLSKIEAGKIDLEQMDFDPERAAYDVCHLISPRLGDKTIELLCRIDDEMPTVVKGDEGKFKQVLINLLGNAAKFTESGEIEISLKVAQRQKDGIKLLVEVRDTGMGIEKDRLEDIFRAFEQADGTITRRFGGTGLGLAISKRLATMMGGDLSVQSTPGQGSRFYFTAWMQPGEVAAAEKAVAAFALKGKKVFVADDNAASLAILVRYLQQVDMQVTAVGNPADVLPILTEAAEENAPYDMCMLDIEMLQINGFEVAATIRGAAGPLKTMPLLALLSLARGDGERCGRAGFDSFITKPVMRPELYGALHRLLADQVPPEPECSAAVQQAGEDRPSQQGRILLVEDSEVNLMLAEDVLSSEGFGVQTAANGQQALEVYTQDPDAFDLILMDVQMPVMDGLTATERIRQWEANHTPSGKGRRVPIIAMTAGALKGDRQKCLQAGMDDYIAKPINLDEVLKLVSGLISS